MWELARHALHRGNPVQRIFSFVLAVIVTVFLVTSMSSSLSHAASDDANWDGNSITYNGNQYTAGGSGTNQNGLSLPSGSTYYTYVDQNSNTPADSSVDIIYFTKGQDTSTATSAHYVTYTLDMSSEPYQFSNPHDQQAISVDASSGGKNQGTSCAITGVGWIVCSVSNFLATGMDWLMTNILQNFLLVHPLSTTLDKGNSLYQAWNMIRSIANVAFIIAFLVIIYSQMTGLGVSNYNIKKMFPRLIVAAILVNLSYYICAVTVDASNVVGVSIEHIMVGLRSSLYHVTSESTAGQASWTSVTGFVLSGGTAVAAAGIGTVALATATSGSVTSLIFLILPALVGLLLAALVAFLILAARQALIIILTIISPLAFVAYLLPNTEQWFKKWRQLFTTMLVFFPAFALVFAGAQLAGGLIVANASSLTTMVLGMIVQVIPLGVTPWLLRFSGSTIQGIAKQAQGFNKRMQGATSNWAKPHAESFKRNALGADLRGGNIARRLGRWGNHRQEVVKQRGEAGQANFEAYSQKRTATSRSGQARLMRLDQGKKRTAVISSQVEKAQADLAAGSLQGFQELRAMKSHGKTGIREVASRVFSSDMPIENYFDANGTLRSEFTAKAHSRKMTERMSSERVASRALGSAVKLAHRSRITAQAEHNAKEVYEEQFGHLMNNASAASQEMRTQAGGINTHQDIGAQIARASAIQTISKAHAESMVAASTVIANYQFNDTNMANLAVNGTATNAQGEVLTGELFRQAAFNTAAKIGIASTISEALKHSSTLDTDTRNAFKGILDENNSTVKGTAFWAVDDNVKQAVITGQTIDEPFIKQIMLTQVSNNKLSPELLSTQDASTLQLLQQAVAGNPVEARKVHDIADEILRNQRLAGAMKRNARGVMESF